MNGQFKVEIIPQKERVESSVPCSDESCAYDASVRITSPDQEYKTTPFCSGHAHVVFADWMVGVE